MNKCLTFVNSKPQGGGSHGIMLLKQLLIIISVIATGVTCFAGTDTSTEDTASSIVSADLLKSNDVSVNVYPYAFFNPEVKVAFGVGGIITFYTSADKNLRPSKVALSGYYSTSKQYKIGLSPQVYLFGNRTFASVKMIFAIRRLFETDNMFHAFLVLKLGSSPV